MRVSVYFCPSLVLDNCKDGARPFGIEREVLAEADSHHELEVESVKQSHGPSFVVDRPRGEALKKAKKMKLICFSQGLNNPNLPSMPNP